jgi:hypothetical protein
LEQRHAGGFHRQIGPRSHRNSDVRFGQRRSVIDPVPRHRDDPTLGPEVSDKGGFVGRKEARMGLIDSNLFGYTFRYRLTVAGQHDHPDSPSFQFGHNRTAAGFDRILKSQNSRRLLVDGNVKNRFIR